ncbi:hypothetical protein CVT24_000591 [Panaeolus cyanescens]|uniref:Uncharacterized protein n=1 Tax=Panaeolus cyanescens TaxID=181874 RepID=A0A409YY17_9AGAR|nr:hypothetical protein CVT24_000591 [Panaeolus cyanescens]
MAVWKKRQAESTYLYPENDEDSRVAEYIDKQAKFYEDHNYKDVDYPDLHRETLAKLQKRKGTTTMSPGPCPNAKHLLECKNNPQGETTERRLDEETDRQTPADDFKIYGAKLKHLTQSQIYRGLLDFKENQKQIKENKYHDPQDTTTKLLEKKGLPDTKPTMGDILSCGWSPRNKISKEDKGRNRLRTIVISESAYLIWKVRCEWKIGRDKDPRKAHTIPEITNRWTSTINKRLNLDRLHTNKRKFPKSKVDKTLAYNTWNGTLGGEAANTDGWVKTRVLVGIEIQDLESHTGVHNHISPGGINLPSGWDQVSPEKRFLYMLFTSMDANFHLKKQLVSSYKQDPGLGLAMAYMVPLHKHKAYALKHASQDDGLRYMDVGAVICARSEIMLPLRVGNLQKGERFCNMDYVFMSSIQSFLELAIILISYDRACQWFINFGSRVAGPDWPANLKTPGSVKLIPAISKLHEPMHKQENHQCYLLNHILGAGNTDGKGIERLWWPHNTVGKVTQANRNIQKEAHESFSCNIKKEVVNDWKHLCMEWDADESIPKSAKTPFNLEGTVLIELQVQKESDEEEDKRIKAGGLGNGLSLRSRQKHFLLMETKVFVINELVYRWLWMPGISSSLFICPAFWHTKVL